MVEGGGEAVVRHEVDELRHELRTEPDELLLDLPGREPARAGLLGDGGPPLHVEVLVQREPDPHPLPARRAVHAAGERRGGGLVPVALDRRDRVQPREAGPEEAGRGVLAEHVHVRKARSAPRPNSPARSTALSAPTKAS